MESAVAIILLALAMQAVQPSPAQPQGEKPKLICRENEQRLGTRIHVPRRCQTAEEWQREYDARDKLPTTLRVVPDQGDGLPQQQRPQS